MIKKIGAEYSNSISGANSDPENPGLWQFDWPAHHQVLKKIKTVQPIKTSRSWLRVIPENYPDGIPSISVFDDNPKNVKLRPPGRPSRDIGDKRIVICGPCEFGYIAYIINENNDMIWVSDLSGFLQKKGEIWVSIGDIFDNKNGKKIINRIHLLKDWKWGMINAMQCLDALDASEHRRIIIGIEGLKGSIWGGEFTEIPVQESKMIYDVSKHKWSVQDQKDFLENAWNKLLDVFSLSPSDGASNLGSCLKCFDEQYSNPI